MEVHEGQIIVNDIRLVVDRPEVKIWNIDCRSKYFDVYLTWGHEFERPEETDYEINLWSNERTLYVDQEKEGSTRIVLPIKEDGWLVIADWAKYSAIICMYKYTGTNELAWEREGLLEERAGLRRQLDTEARAK